MRKLVFCTTTWIIAATAAVAITVYSGVIHGRMSNRWGSPPRTAEAVARIAAVPQKFGHWEMQQESLSTAEVREMLQLDGELSRTYKHDITGDVVTLNVFIGPPGPISEHTPEICMGSQHWRHLGSRQQRDFGAAASAAGDEASHELWATEFEERRATGRRVRVYYGWTTGGPWQAPAPGLGRASSRAVFAGSPYLYKLQLMCLSPPTTYGQTSHDAGERFLNDFLPVLNQYLVPAVNE